jgi:predicted dehydrogenase
MAGAELRIGVIGCGRWAHMAHLPGWTRDPRCEVVAVCDRDRALADEAAARFGIAEATDDHRRVIERDDVDVIDVITGDSEHFTLTMAALEAGKHVLCEKPVAHDYRDTLRARDLADSKGLRTKVGFTFRYSPAVRYMKELIDSGFVGTPYIYNAYEQNSQWIDPQTPLRQVPPDTGDRIAVSSLEGYGAPVIDLGHWFMESDLTAVVGVMRNFVPERMIRETGQMTRANIDDGDIFLGEFASGAICSVQSSFVTVGNYPGIEVRVYGSEGALIARLVEEFGIAETLKSATPDAVEFVPVDVPDRLYPPGGTVREDWPRLFYSNLTASFADEILSADGASQGGFADAAWVQEVINAVERSHHERAWVSLPLTG